MSIQTSRRVQQIERLTRDIEAVATKFEAFGGAFLEVLLGTPLNHSGINLQGYPVAGVVDSVSPDGLLVAEYSDASNYFQGKLEKPCDDLKKALKRRPTARQFYLLSGRSKAPRAAQAFERRVLKWKRMEGRTLHLWGSQEIAAKIVDELLFSDSAVRKLSVYLPALKNIVEEEAVNWLAPIPAEGRFERDTVDSEIHTRLCASPVLALTGLSGLGKSDSARAFAARHRDDYDLVIWLDGNEVPKIEALSALSLARGGESRNIVGLMQTRTCLLVIDDAPDALCVAELAKLCAGNSHILLTRQKVTSGSYELPPLTRLEAEAVVSQNGEDCPPVLMDKIWTLVGGHPMTLTLVSAAKAEGATWEQISADCDAVGRLETDGQLLADRLVGHLRRLLAEELSFFAWAGQSSCDEAFTESQILPLGIRKLRQRGLVAADRRGLVRLHDVIQTVISHDEWCSAERATRLDGALETYLLSAAQENELQLWKTARQLRPKLEALVARGDRRISFRYALLCTWDAAETRPELVGDTLAEAQALAGSVPPPLAVLTVIEGIEQLYLLEKITSMNVARTGLEARLPAFDVLDQLPGLSSLDRARIQHHKGKALKRLRRLEEAALLFEAVMDGPIPMAEARLQLIDVYQKSNPKGAEAHARVILGYSVARGEVGYSVYLGAIERIPAGQSGWPSIVFAQFADRIESVIVEAAHAGLHHAFAAFAAIGRFLSRENPELFLKILKQIPDPAPDALLSDRERAAWGEIAFEASRSEQGNTRARLLQAKAFYESVSAPDGFHNQRLAELLIELGELDAAAAMLLAREELPESEWLQRLMARVCHGQGQHAEALSWIEQALDRLDGEKFRSEFLELRHDIRHAMNDPKAIEDLRAAIEASQKPREREQLALRLDAFAGQAGVGGSAKAENSVDQFAPKDAP